MARKRRSIGSTIGFLILVILCFGLILSLMYLLDVRWYAFAAAGGAVLLLFLLRLTPIWRGPGVLICWLLALAVSGFALDYFREDRQISLSGNLQREVQRVGFGLMKQHVDLSAILDNLLARQGVWQPPRDFTHYTVELSHSKLEFVESRLPSGKLIYQMHGGAYIVPLINLYRNQATRLSKLANGAGVALLDYRVAPANHYPAALDDAIEGWNYLLELGYAPDDILLFGDSNGGGLALALTLWLRDQGRELPGGIITISAWADLAEEGESYHANLYRDPSLGIWQGQDQAGAGLSTSYVGEADPHDPYLSAVYGDYHGFPPLLLLAGSWEMLASDSQTIHAKARRASVDSRLINAHGMFHVYPFFPYSRETNDAWRAISEFMNMRLAD